MKIPIIATSLLKFGELWNKGINDLIREIGKKALNEAGITPNKIDALYIANEFSSKVNGQSLLNSISFEELGIKSSVCIQAGDASGAAAIKEAANSILSEQNKLVMVLGAEKVTDLKTNDIMLLSSDFISQHEESFIGASVQSQFAIITRKYLNDFKLNSDSLSSISAEKHKNAVNNEYAQYRFELTGEKINSSPIFVDPIRMLDCASYCDGAAALIMCNEETAKNFSGKIKGYLLASSSANDSLALSKRKSITTIESTVKASKNAYETAGIKAGEIGLFEVYDIVPISEILAIEDLGFAKKGEGIKFVKKNIDKINYSGGLKACGHAVGATGIRQAVDIIKSLKNNKVKYGLTHTLGGTGSISVINIFEGS